MKDVRSTSDKRVNLSLYVMDARIVRSALVNSFPAGWLREPEARDDDTRRATRRLIAVLDERIDRASRRLQAASGHDARQRPELAP